MVSLTKIPLSALLAQSAQDSAKEAASETGNCCDLLFDYQGCGCLGDLAV